MPPVKGELVVITDDVLVVGINTMKITVTPNTNVSANGFLWSNDKVNISDVTLKLTDKRDQDKFNPPSYSPSCNGVISTTSPCVITITQHELQPVFHAMSYRISANNASSVDRSFVIKDIMAGYPKLDDPTYCDGDNLPASGQPCKLSILNATGAPIDLHDATFSSKYVTFSNNDCTGHVIPNNEICQVTETLIEDSGTQRGSDVILKKKGSYVDLICAGFYPGWECLPGQRGRRAVKSNEPSL